MPGRRTNRPRRTVCAAFALLAALAAHGCGTDPQERYAATLDGVCADVRRALTTYTDAATLIVKGAGGGGAARLGGSVHKVSQAFIRSASELRDLKPPEAFADFNEGTADGLSTAGERLAKAAATAGDDDTLLSAAQDALGALPAQTPPPGLDARAPRCRV